MTTATAAPVARAADAAPSTGGRVTSLDGLRGLAALVVVAHHALLVWPVLYAQYGPPNRTSATWYLAYTPLHLLWAGREAVIIFFILSGFVLVLPYLGRKKVGTWPGYLVRRVLRLYPPVVVALLLSGALVTLFPRNPLPGSSMWYARHDVPVEAAGMLHDMFLLDGTGMVNSVLWSLRYEVAFSLLLPLVILVVRRVPPRLALTLPVALGLVVCGQFSGSHWGQWLPIFAVGVAMAVGREDLHRLAARIESSALRVVIWWTLALGSAGLILAEWVLRAFRLPLSTWAVWLPGPVAFGCALACFIVLGCPGVSRVFSGRALQWAGKISFSLYLVHEPIVVSVASLVPPGLTGAMVTVVVGGAISILVAMAFHALVEGPWTRWSRAIGKRIDRIGAPRGRHVAYRHESAAPRREVPAPRREVPAVRREVPASRREVPASRREVPASRRSVPASRREAPASRHGVPSDRPLGPSTDVGLVEVR
jgi:peptidoglycan/LPS O-acetylase OafA/YrhL